MVVVALFITVMVYGVVALIVKMDDIGLSLAGRQSETTQKARAGPGQRYADPSHVANNHWHCGHCCGWVATS